MPDYLGLMMSMPAAYQEAASGLRAQATVLGEVTDSVVSAQKQAGQGWEGAARQGFDRAVQLSVDDLRTITNVLRDASTVLGEAADELGQLVTELRSISEEAEATGFLIIPPEGVVVIGPAQEAEAAGAGPGAPAVIAAYEAAATAFTGVMESIVAAATALDAAIAAQLQGALAILVPGQGAGGFLAATGAGWVDPDQTDPNDAAAYERIKQQLGDVEAIAANTGIEVDVIRQVKKHFFLTTHDVAMGPNDIRRDRYFTPYHTYWQQWDAATAGPLQGRELDSFRRFMAHEYVESRLMESGMPYLSPAPQDWADGTYKVTARSAHILAPFQDPTRDPFYLWPKLGLTPPGPIASDLSNLDDVVAAALRGPQP